MSITEADLKAQLEGNKNFNVYCPSNPSNMEAIRKSAIPRSSLYWNITGLVSKVPPPPPRVPKGQRVTRESDPAPAVEEPDEVVDTSKESDQAKGADEVVAALPAQLPAELPPGDPTPPQMMCSPGGCCQSGIRMRIGVCLSRNGR